MKIAIISDIHANLEALQAVVADIEAQGVDRIVCLGDIVGYNANPAECVQLVRDLEALCVGGNHDRGTAGKISTAGFPERAARSARWTRAQLNADALRFLGDLPLEVSVGDQLVAVHGTLRPDGGCEKTYLNSDERRLECLDSLRRHPSGARICAYGHTHELAIFELSDGMPRRLAGDEVTIRDDALYLVNPGTVGEPRDEGEWRASYFLLDTALRKIRVRHVEYDRALSIVKMKKAGLGPSRGPLKGALRAMFRWSRRRLRG